MPLPPTDDVDSSCLSAAKIILAINLPGFSSTYGENIRAGLTYETCGYYSDRGAKGIVA